ncbi:aminotransferase class I/II-fold pyridoxal phosphate-dependent enzyme [Neisseria weixii]|uniref:Putative 8-amino-7-oxononanoate synthase n=1 Tax=Neisseria weixii TaxID=1853276 RepID=A0A3N4N3R6_9NEIS|nr:8-amino-7-oxononanoate synthase [Neisseria weixii]ATD65771.1 8-amino-7-oxononanoate synthase [Neisseria weixii]RPD90862.1 8-amino-7-oxononanoate synthase [Neisseria weixii]RPD91056.1 8-amino-7-oxononanoate synthase [Neisseria weixii]
MQHFKHALEELKAQDRLRRLPDLPQQGRYIVSDGLKLLNLSSNDYLGLAHDKALRHEFLNSEACRNLPWSSSSSRLLTGGFPIYQELEALLAARYQREAALLFNSGYHANVGILPALADKKTLILADKWVHASLIDGIRLSGADYLRYRHNDYAQLERLLEQRAADYRCVIIVTESLFSMDGDTADLPHLVRLKKRYGHVLLYVDEAHAVGAYGETGLGLAEMQDCVADIDILTGTFGKALASVGAFAVCSGLIKEYLTNHMRTLIFSTALPPVNMAWTHFVFRQLPGMKARRERLAGISRRLREAVAAHHPSPMPAAANSHIIPCVLGSNGAAVKQAQAWQKQGYYCLPIRPPTVPPGSARVRLSLTADISDDELDGFIQTLGIVDN